MPTVKLPDYVEFCAVPVIEAAAEQGHHAIPDHGPSPTGSRWTL